MGKMADSNEIEESKDSQAETLDARDYQSLDETDDATETPDAVVISSDWGKSYRWEAKIEWLFLSVFGNEKKGCDAQVEGVFQLPSGRRMLLRVKPYHEGGRFPQKGDTFEDIQSWAVEMAEALTEALAIWSKEQAQPESK